MKRCSSLRCPSQNNLLFDNWNQLSSQILTIKPSLKQDVCGVLHIIPETKDSVRLNVFTCFILTTIEERREDGNLRQSVSVSSRLLSTTSPTVLACRCGE